jgi:Fic family protein
MAYIYNKKINNESHYYLRVSLKKEGKQITKDIAYLGKNIEEVKEKLQNLPKKDQEQIKKTYKTIHRFLEKNIFLEQIRKQKNKKDKYLGNIDELNAIVLHYNKNILSLDNLTKQEIFESFVVDFCYNTTSIEGNTITLKEAELLLSENLTPKNKTLREIFDLKNTKDVFFEILAKKPELTHEIIIEIHKKLMKDIDDRTNYRTRDVRVFKARFKSSPAFFVKKDMDLLINWYNQNVNKINPFVLASMFHHKFEKIHPFFDGNGRTGRMILNLLLLKQNYPPIIIRNKNRIKYLNALSSADKDDLLNSDPKQYKEFLDFCLKEYKENYWNTFI